MRTILGFVALIFITAIFWGSFNLGVFKSVEFSEGQAGPFLLVGKAHTGSYHEISPIITEVESWARLQGLDCTLTFGHYYDDPNIVENLRLRSRGGCMLTAEEWAKSEVLELPEGYVKEIIPSADFFIAQFAGSPWIGPYKVYGKAEEKLYSGGSDGSTQRMTIFPVLEAYATDGKTIQTTYYFGR